MKPAMYKATSPLGSFTDDINLHVMVDSTVASIKAKLDEVMRIAQEKMSFKGHKDAVPVHMRHAFNRLRTREGRISRDPVKYRSQFAEQYRQVQLPIGSFAGPEVSAIFSELYVRVCAASLPRRVIVASVSLHPDLIGRGIWRYIELALREWAKSKFATFEYENVGNPLLLTNLFARDTVTHAVGQAGAAAMYPHAAQFRSGKAADLPDNWGAQKDGRCETQDAYVDTYMDHAARLRHLGIDSPCVSAPLDVHHLLQCTLLQAVSAFGMYASTWECLAGHNDDKMRTMRMWSGASHYVVKVGALACVGDTGLLETEGWPVEAAAHCYPHRVARKGDDFVVDINLYTDHYDDNLKCALYAALEHYGLERDGLSDSKPATMTMVHPLIAIMAPLDARTRIQVFLNKVYQLTVKV